VSENLKQSPETSSSDRSGSRAVPNIFDSLGCKVLAYDLTVSRDSFDLEAFYSAGRIPDNERTSWSGVCAPRKPASGYHVHFRGTVNDKSVRMSVEYVHRSIKPRPDEREPFAETFMNWLGKFIRTLTSHAIVHGRFEKPNERWRSRFNLPFKVTLSGLETEVMIDGISLVLPDNKWGAKHGWVTRDRKELIVSVRLERRINVKKFQLDDELRTVNESIRMFAEEIAK
jgi:hypothetical protein